MNDILSVYLDQSGPLSSWSFQSKFEWITPDYPVLFYNVSSLVKNGHPEP